MPNEPDTVRTYEATICGPSIGPTYPVDADTFDSWNATPTVVLVLMADNLWKCATVDTGSEGQSPIDDVLPMQTTKYDDCEACIEALEG